MDAPGLPPETLEGWYALHQLFTIDRNALRALKPEALRDMRCESGESLAALLHPQGEGWSAVVSLIGSTADVLLMHFRSTLDELGDAQRAVAKLPMMQALRPAMHFLSVTELGLYRLAAHGQDDPQK